MRVWGNEFKQNRYCLRESISSPLQCDETVQKDRSAPHLAISYGGQVVIENDVFQSGCFLRPFIGFSLCTETPYVFSYP